MFFLFLSFNAAIKKHLCVCQPDRPGSVCTLNKKCRNFKTEDQILLIEKKPTHASKRFVNIYEILSENKNKGEKNIKLDFSVFGSLPSNPIIFDFTGTDKIIEDETEMEISIKIKGSEWKQLINVTGLDTISNNIWSNYSAYSLSLSISDITALFNIETNQTTTTFIDTLQIEKSRLILPERKSFTFNTRNLYTDAISSYSEFSGQIITKTMTFLEPKDPSLIKEFQSPILIQNKDKTIKADSETSETPETPETSENEEANNFQYNFCLSNKDSNERAFEELACDMHSVPHDYQHYITVKNTDIAEIIRNAPSNNIIRFFLTESNSNNPCSFILHEFNNSNHTILFQVADPDYPAYLTLKGSNLGSEHIKDKNINVTFHTISYINIDTNLLESFRNVTLRSSQLTFADDRQEGSVQNLVTDSQSISQFSGKLNILQSIELRKTTPRRIQGSILMANDSSIIVPQMSNFPIILFKDGRNIGNYSICLCDVDEHIEMPFYFNPGFINIALSDNVPTITDKINLTFRNDASLYNRDTDPTPDINITTFVPSQGLNVTFGTANSKQWPKHAVFSFENLDLDNEEDKANYPLIFLTILDGSAINSIENAANSVFMYFYKVNICLLSFSSFGPFINGVNRKNKPCPAIQRPHFANPTGESCFQTGTYSIGYATLDIFDILREVQFESEKIFFVVDNGDSIKFPNVSSQVVMLTTSPEITYKDASSDINLINNFQLQPSAETNITFDATFVNSFEGKEDLLQRLKIVHDGIDLNLKTDNNKPVPQLVLDDDVQGVHIFTNDGAAQVYKVEGNSYTGSWIGPNVSVQYSSSITVPQRAFLADTVSFEATSGNPQVNFIYYNKSVSDYTFRNSIISFSSDNNDKVVNVSAKSITLDRSTIRQNTNSVGLNLEVDQLIITDLSSIPSSSFSSPIIMHERASIIVPVISKIIFSEGSVKIFNGNVETATITHIPTTTSSTTTPPSTRSRSKVLLEGEAEMAQSGFYVSTPTDNEIELEVNGSSLPEDFKLDLTGNNPKLNIDKSFNNVKVPDDFKIESKNKYTIDTDLRELPKGLAQGSVNVNHAKQKLTKNLGFIIFIVIFGVLLVVGIILCIVGLTCMPTPEQYDLSSEGTSQIFDDSREATEKKINTKDGEIDFTSSGADLEDIEDAEEEKKKKNDEGKEEEKDQVKPAQVEKPSGSYSVEIEQDNKTDEDTDDYFDDTGSSEEKPKK